MLNHMNFSINLRESLRPSNLFIHPIVNQDIKLSSVVSRRSVAYVCIFLSLFSEKKSLFNRISQFLQSNLLLIDAANYFLHQLIDIDKKRSIYYLIGLHGVQIAKWNLSGLITVILYCNKMTRIGLLPSPTHLPLYTCMRFVKITL